jgi:hypothetical protein
MTQVSLEMNLDELVKGLDNLGHGKEMYSKELGVRFRKDFDSDDVRYTRDYIPNDALKRIPPRKTLEVLTRLENNYHQYQLEATKEVIQGTQKIDLNLDELVERLDNLGHGKEMYSKELGVRFRKDFDSDDVRYTRDYIPNDAYKRIPPRKAPEVLNRLANNHQQYQLQATKELHVEPQIPDREKGIKTAQTLELKREYLLEELDYLQPFASYDSEYFNVEFSMEENGHVTYEINMDQVQIINPEDILQGFRELVKHTSSHPLNFEVNGEFGYLQIDGKDPVIIQTASYDYNNRGTIAYLRNGMDGTLIKSGNLHEIKGELLDEMTTSMTVEKIHTAAPHNRINSSFDAKEFPIKVKDFLKENLGLLLPQIHQISTAFLDKVVSRFAEINSGIMLVTNNEIGKGLPAQDRNATFLKIERDENMRPTSVKPVNDLSELIQSKPYQPQNKNYGTELYAELRERISVPSYRNVSMSQYQNLKGMMNPPKFSAFQNIDSTMNIVFDVKDTGKINEVTKPKHLNKELAKPRGR